MNKIDLLGSEFTRQAGEASRLLKALSNESRLLVLCFLTEAGELSAGELTERVGLSQSALSQHLAKLRLARIVTTRQEGTRVFYRLSDEHAVAIVDEALKQAEHAIGAPHHHE